MAWTYEHFSLVRNITCDYLDSRKSMSFLQASLGSIPLFKTLSHQLIVERTASSCNQRGCHPRTFLARLEFSCNSLASALCPCESFENSTEVFKGQAVVDNSTISLTDRLSESGPKLSALMAFPFNTDSSASTYPHKGSRTCSQGRVLSGFRTVINDCLTKLRTRSGISRSSAQSPPPMTLPARTEKTFGPPATFAICCHAAIAAS